LDGVLLLFSQARHAFVVAFLLVEESMIFFLRMLLPPFLSFMAIILWILFFGFSLFPFYEPADYLLPEFESPPTVQKSFQLAPSLSKASAPLARRLASSWPVPYLKLSTSPEAVIFLPSLQVRSLF